MYAQAQPRHDLLQRRHRRLPVAGLAADDQIVRVVHDFRVELLFVAELFPRQNEPSEVEVGQQWRDHASNNSAKALIIEAILPRASLRPVYGQGCPAGPETVSTPSLSADQTRGGDGHG